MIFVVGIVVGHHEHVETSWVVFDVWQVVPGTRDSEYPVLVLVTGTTVTVRDEPLLVEVKVSQ